MKHEKMNVEDYLQNWFEQEGDKKSNWFLINNNKQLKKWSNNSFEVIHQSLKNFFSTGK